ncbi:MAG: hypothetical protein QHI48_03985 [Bacteroidota bacterium]|nr:hypothetical protein [Bacteroidota bacterium]
MNERHTIRLLENYAIDESSISPEETAELRLLLESSPYWRELFTEMKSYYREVEGLSELEPSPAELALWRKLTKSSEPDHPTILKLSPEIRQRPSHGRKPRTLKLAAQESLVRKRVQHCETFITPDESVLIRVLKNNEQGRYFFQVHSDNPIYSSGIVVTFDGVTGGFLTDACGAADMGSVSSLPPQLLHAYVHPSIDAFDIRDEDRETLVNTGTIMLTGSQGNNLRVDAQCGSERIHVSFLPVSPVTEAHFIAITYREGLNPTVTHLDSNRAMFSTVHLDIMRGIEVFL